MATISQCSGPLSLKGSFLHEKAAEASCFCLQRVRDTALASSSASAPSTSSSSTSSRLHVTAMANPRRTKMVAQQIRREVSEMLLFDKVIRDAITPEHALGADKYLSSVATVSEVEVSGDLQVAKVYVSVYGDERGQELAMAALKSLCGYVRQGLGRKMRLRFTPEVRFIQDEAIERGSRVLSILSQLERERTAHAEGQVLTKAPMLAQQDEDDELFDDFGDFGSLDEIASRKDPRDSRAKGKQVAARKSTTQSKDGGNIFLI